MSSRECKSAEALPFVTVVMPVRNEEDAVHRSLSAVIGQDYPAERMEIIVADGMSTDKTRELISQIGERDGRVRLIDNPGKIVSTGLNAALPLARGEIILRVDGHGEIAADYVSRCVQHLQATDVQVVGGLLETCGEGAVAGAIAAAMSSSFGVGNSHFRLSFSRSQVADTVPFPAHKREVMELAGRFDEELVRNQDDEYNYRLRKLGAKLLLAADVRARYWSRGSLGLLWRQYYQYGFWKVRVLQKHPRQMKARQFVPATFVLALIAGGISAAFFSWARIALLGIAALYAVAALAASFWTAAKRGWRYLPVLPAAFATLHLAYGLGFLHGLGRFVIAPLLFPRRLGGQAPG